MKLALIGCGTVGKAFIELLDMKKEELNRSGNNLELCAVLNSKGGIYDPSGFDFKKLYSHLSRGGSLCEYLEHSSQDIDIDFIIEKTDIDTVVLTTPTNKETGEPGITYIRKLLKSGINVITADKGPILLAYNELKKIAEENKAKIGIGCTTGGALPSINAGLIDLAGADIYKIQGVLNGTTNFIINEMESNLVSYEAALKKAQELGIAETNPSLDVEGWDTATKLLILTNVLMKGNKTLKDVNVEGITGLTVEEIEKANKERKRYKLIGTAVREDNEIKITVKLDKIDNTNEFYFVDGKNKAVKYYTDILGELTVIGGASGALPAAASLLRDIINIKRL